MGLCWGHNRVGKSAKREGRPIKNFSLQFFKLMRKAAIKIGEQLAGWLIQDEQGYHFVYDQAYRTQAKAKPVSLTLPLDQTSYSAKVLFPFFDGLIPEGWLLDIAQKNWKLNPRDRMGLLLACCKDCIGAVSVEEVKEEENHE